MSPRHDGREFIELSVTVLYVEEDDLFQNISFINIFLFEFGRVLYKGQFGELEWLWLGVAIVFKEQQTRGLSCTFCTRHSFINKAVEIRHWYFN